MENVFVFSKVALEDETLRNELLAAVEGKGPDEAAEAAASLATSRGYLMTAQEVAEGCQALTSAMTRDGELSDAELQSVSGGAFDLAQANAALANLQAASDKRNQAFEAMTNFIKQMANSRSSTLAHMR